MSRCDCAYFLTLILVLLLHRWLAFVTIVFRFLGLRRSARSFCLAIAAESSGRSALRQ